ncbi:MAG: ion transporter [Methanoregula sp.]|nr:ion transporter [Methanoregula sp.]
MSQVSLLGKLKKFLYDTMEVPASEDQQGLVYELFMSVLIVLNALAMIIGTVGAIQQEYDWILAPFEYFSLVIFSVEYIILLWVCTENPAFSDPIRGRINYMLTPVALINLASVLPAFIPFLVPFDLRALRLLRLFRIIRLLKLTKYSDSLKIIFRALDSKKEQFVLTFVAVIVFVIITSIFVYYAETGENPSEAFSDLPHTIWWGLETLSPVSGEDAVPITVTGKMIMTIYALLQIAIFAIPAGIMCSAFDEQWAKEYNACNAPADPPSPRMQISCPHCSQSFEYDADEGK